ncbi:MAG: hypothetical protein J6X46_07835 [Prevotella sp.]|nr:hypothetical protein [Prevotella sp.]
METFFTFVRSMAKGTFQGFNQYIINDLPSHIPLIITACVIIIIHFAIKLFKNRNK